MDTTTIRELLAADEERLYNTLRADQSIEKSREKSVQTLSEELGTLLLRYNAACGNDRARQAAADALTATARESLDYLLAGEAGLEKTSRQIRAGAPLLLILSLVLAVAGAVVLSRWQLAAYALLGCALGCAFFSGLCWFREGSVRAVSRLSPEGMQRTLRKVTDTMDRKLEELSEVLQEEKRTPGSADGEAAPLDAAELALLGELLEALYTENGEFALRQLRRLRPYLREKGVELAEYGDDTAEYFELFPSKRAPATLRPALLYGKTLLQLGKATVPTE